VLFGTHLLLGSWQHSVFTVYYFHELVAGQNATREACERNGTKVPINRDKYDCMQNSPTLMWVTIAVSCDRDLQLHRFFLPPLYALRSPGGRGMPNAAYLIDERHAQWDSLR